MAVIRFIPQGTVDNNLGPDRLSGPKALDPDHCKKHSLHDLSIEVLTVHGTELISSAYLWLWHSLYL